MKLDGVFYYDSESQRALPFSVDIRELSEENKVFIGSTSKYYLLKTELTPGFWLLLWYRVQLRLSYFELVKIELGSSFWYGFFGWIGEGFFI